MSKVSDNIMDQIKHGSIKPRPRWWFVMMNIFLVIILIVTIIAGGLVMSLVFLKLFNVDWDFVSFNGDHGPSFLKVLPVIWFLLLVIVMLLSVWVFERMEGGYKYHPIWLVLGSVLLSVLLGAVIYTSRAADFFDESLRGFLPPYEAMERDRELLFEAPEKGFLPGKIVELTLPDGFELQDLRQNTWTVTFQGNLGAAPFVKNLQEGQVVMVIGSKTDDAAFTAKDIKTKRAFGGIMLKKVMQNRQDRVQTRMDMLNNPPPLLLIQQQ